MLFFYCLYEKEKTCHTVGTAVTQKQVKGCESWEELSFPSAFQENRGVIANIEGIVKH